MTHTRTVFRIALLAFGLLGILVLQGVGIMQAATPTELFFSEYIEGSSNNKALEIYNGTGSPVDLGTGGYSVQMFFNGSATAGLTINLTGTVANGDVFVLAQSSANGTILAQADQTNGAGWFNGDDAVVLRKGTTIIDVIGQVGFDPGTEWGSGVTSTADNTLQRKDSICAGDPDGSNAFDPSLEWNGFNTDTFSGLGSHTANCSSDDLAPSVTGTSPADGASGVAPNAAVSVTFSEGVTIAGTVNFSCTVSGPQSATPTTSDNITFSMPHTDFVDGDTCTVTVTAGQVSDNDTIDPPDNMTGDASFSFSVTDVCAQGYTAIPSIQGSGLSAAITGNVTTEGIVVGDYEGSTGLSGFYLQDATGDANTATSDGIFVYTGSADLVSAGQNVRVSGFARERFNQTTLNGSNSNNAAVPAANIVICGTGSVTPVDVTMPFADANYLEQFEGMLVRFPQELVISEYFNYERFGEMVLALPLPGESRPFTPTAIDEPGAPALARALANSLRRITLDDGLGIQNPSSVRHPNGAPFALNNRFRGGDIVQNVVGILGYDFDLYRIQPTGPADYTAANTRPAAPESVGGRVHVAAMNTLNYFLTLDYPAGNPLDNKCGPLQNVECRGADSDQPLEFTRQRDKLLAALAGLNADIIGLNEIENTAGVNPLGDPTNGIVAGLNALLGPGTYDYIDTGVIGTDAIRVGLIYKPAKVMPVGGFQILDTSDDARFLDNKNRPVLAQTFEEVGTGARFTVAVNHFKSKGSDCNDVGDPDIGDGQGNCNLTRSGAGMALVDWLASDPTGSGDPDFLIMGDLNSYAQEDPIDLIKIGSDDTAGTGDDFVNLISLYQGTYAYSYVFDGQAGYLDHALANLNLASQVTGATEWHINADEPDILDYDTTFKPPAQDALYEANGYRSSDHDPVLVGLNPNVAPSCAAAVPSIASIWPANHNFVNVDVLGVTDPDNDSLTITISSIFQDEVVNGTGDGATSPDGQGVGSSTAQVRAERDGKGNGRVYHISFTADDGYGNSCTGTVLVGVPKSASNNHPAIDDGPLYDSTLP